MSTGPDQFIRIAPTRSGKVSVRIEGTKTLEPVDAYRTAWHLVLAALEVEGQISREQAKRLRPLSESALVPFEIDPVPMVSRDSRRRTASEQ